MKCQANRSLPARRSCTARSKILLLALFAGTMLLSACGSGSSSTVQQDDLLTLSGNWQFTMAPPSDGSFLGGLQGGFLLDNGGSVTGAATYSVSLPGLLVPCSTGSAAISGNISGQNLTTLTAVAGTQTFTLTGTLSLDGLSLAGTYSSTSGTAADGAPCGTAQTGLQWSAILVPPISGPVEGSFHSTGGAAGLSNQDFPVSGSLNQANNTGATAAITGNLTFLNPLTNLSAYPCFSSAAVFGQISGSSMTLEIVGNDGSELGLIGEPLGSLGGTGVNPVSIAQVQSGHILTGAGPTYLVSTNPASATPCPGGLENVTAAGDYGNVCLGLNGASGCEQPFTLTPATLTFIAQAVDTTSAPQTITLANTSTITLNGLTVTLANNCPAMTGCPTNYTETDNCGVAGVPSEGAPFYLLTQTSCVITITFTPQVTCAPGTVQCPSPLTATLTVASPDSVDSDSLFAVPITGTAVDNAAIVNWNSDFSVESLPEASIPHSRLTMAATGHTVQTLPRSINHNWQDVEHHADID
jgi:hypothetical protein